MWSTFRKKKSKNKAAKHDEHKNSINQTIRDVEDNDLLEDKTTKDSKESKLLQPNYDKNIQYCTNNRRGTINNDDASVLSGPRHVDDTSGELMFSSFRNDDVNTLPSSDDNHLTSPTDIGERKTIFNKHLDNVSGDDDVLSGPQYVPNTSGELMFSRFCNYDVSAVSNDDNHLTSPTRASGPRYVDDDDEKTLSRQKQATHHGCDDQKDSVHRRRDSGPRHVTDDDDDENETVVDYVLDKKQAFSSRRQPTTKEDGRTTKSIDNSQKKRTARDRGPRCVLDDDDDDDFNKDSNEYYYDDEEIVIAENKKNDNDENIQQQQQQQQQQHPGAYNILPEYSSELLRPGTVTISGPCIEDDNQTLFGRSYQHQTSNEINKVPDTNTSVISTFGRNNQHQISSETHLVSDATTSHDKDLAIAAVVAPDEEDIEARVQHRLEQETENIENQVQRRIEREAVTPELVEKVESHRERRIKRAILIILAISAIATIVGLAVGLSGRNNSDTKEVTLSPTATPVPTLQLVNEAGVLKCSGGFDMFELCRAVAAAVFGAPGVVEFIPMAPAERFAALANGTIHLADFTTPTMERDMYQKHAKAGFSFTTPYFYDGLAFGGIPKFVRCADKLDAFRDCSDLKICVNKDTTNFDFLDLRLPASAIITTSNISKGLIENSCNVIASVGVEIAEPVVRYFGYLGNYSVGNAMYLKDPLSLMTRDDDPEWSDFVNSVLRCLFTAETMNITQRTAHKFTTTSVFGEEYENMFIDAITSVGNYGEIHARNITSLVPRSVINSLNTNGSTGLIYSLPFGDIQRSGPGPSPRGTLERILARGKLLCGIRTSRPGFAHFNKTTQKYNGLDVDYCHTLASSVFRSNWTAVEFVPFATSNVSDIFVALADGTLDVAAGIGITLERDVREPTTGEGFDFSEPYFYQPPEGPLENTPSLVTRQDDHQWSAYVHWIVIATFYAEENSFTHDLSFQMPLVGILGPGFARMLRDAILVGNYGELYQRNVEEFIPRSGRNMLNKDPFGPQINPYFVWDG